MASDLNERTCGGCGQKEETQTVAAARKVRHGRLASILLLFNRAVSFRGHQSHTIDEAAGQRTVHSGGERKKTNTLGDRRREKVGHHRSQV